MEKKNILKKVFLKIFKKCNTENKMSDMDCLKLAQEVLNSFQPNDQIDLDPFQCRARRALLSSVVFCLYFEHTPYDWEFVRIMNLLEKAKEEAKPRHFETSLALMFTKENEEKPRHFGQRELDVFLMASTLWRYEIIDNILQNLQNPARCKQMFDIAKQKMTEPREHIVTYREYHYELECMKARLESEAQSCVPNIHNVIQFVNRGSYDKANMDINVYNVGDVSEAALPLLNHCIEMAVEMAGNFKYNGYYIVKS